MHACRVGLADILCDQRNRRQAGEQVEHQVVVQLPLPGRPGPWLADALGVRPDDPIAEQVDRTGEDRVLIGDGRGRDQVGRIEDEPDRRIRAELVQQAGGSGRVRTTFPGSGSTPSRIPAPLAASSRTSRVSRMSDQDSGWAFSG